MRRLVFSRTGVLCLVFSLPFYTCSFAQTINSIPKIGDTCPAYILKNIHYYYKKTVTSNDFLGKPIILDFFSYGCKSCFESFPELNTLKKEFSGQVEFMLIAKQYPGFEKQYENYMKHYGLDLPVEYDDSTIWKLFGIYGVPHTVWIDRYGIIRQITTTFGLTSARIKAFLKGQSLDLNIDAAEVDASTNTGQYDNFYDYNKPLLIGGNGGSDTSFMFRSILTKWDYRSSVRRHFHFDTWNKKRIQETGVTLHTLFNLAYGDTVDFLIPRALDEANVENHYGLWATQPVIESRKKNLFESDYDSTKNIFSYSLILLDSVTDARKRQRMMQRDLENFFALTATVETRKMPCLNMVAIGNTKALRTHGGETINEENYSGFTLQNQPIDAFLFKLFAFFQKQPVLIDRTEINFNIDLHIDAIMTDLADVKRALREKGLDIVPGEQEMKVIVIRDLPER